MAGKTGPCLIRRLAAALLALAPALCVGCASRFTADTQYVAPGFTRGSLRGQTVAVLPLAPGPSAAVPSPAPSSAPSPAAPDTLPAMPASNPSTVASSAEVHGVTRGIREAGARVRVIDPADDLAAAVREAAAGAAYLLVVRVIDDDVYRAYALRGRGDGDGRRVASRTSGRRLNLRLTLLRLPDNRPVWLAGGTGEAWDTRAGGPSDAAALREDLQVGNLPFYPPPPPPESLSRRLTRRLIARLPTATELEPN